MDFRAQIEKGLQANKLVEDNRAEIERVLKDINLQLTGLTSGVVGLKIAKLKRSGFLNISSSGTLLSSNYQAIVIFNTKTPDNFSELAEWEVSDRGYPCSVSFDGERHDCFDKASLEITLGDMLARPETGAAIQLLLNPPVVDSSETSDQM